MQVSSRCIAALLLAVAFAGWLPCLPAHADGRSGELVLGCISADPKADYNRLKPLLDYIVPRMAVAGIRSGRILMASDARQMAGYLERGQVDWITAPAGTGMLVARRSGASVLLLGERDGIGREHALFLARNDSGIDSLADLGGQRLALQHAGSTHSYFVPVAQVLDAGFVLQRLSASARRPRAPAVGYLFAGSQDNIVAWLHAGLADAGVVSNVYWGNPRLPAAGRHEGVQVIAEGPALPRAIELVRPDLGTAVRERLHAVLLHAAQDPDGREALMHYFKTTRFLPLDAPTRQALEQLADDVQRARTEVE